MQPRDKIIDVALRYVYDTRLPSPRVSERTRHRAVRGQGGGCQAESLPAISFKITVKGKLEMNYWIEKKDAFRIVGVKEHYSMSLEDCFAT